MLVIGGFQLYYKNRICSSATLQDLQDSSRTGKFFTPRPLGIFTCLDYKYGPESRVFRFRDHFYVFRTFRNKRRQALDVQCCGDFVQFIRIDRASAVQLSHESRVIILSTFVINAIDCAWCGTPARLLSQHGPWISILEQAM